MRRCPDKRPAGRFCFAGGPFQLRRALLLFGGLVVLMLAGVDQAWAVQTHGGSEGLVSHQIGHFLFTLGMICLLVRVQQIGLASSGWPEFKFFLGLLVVWNIMTFSGHWMNEYVTPDSFVIDSSGGRYFTVETTWDVVYYLTRLDHFILVPALFLLMMALKKWRQQS